MQNIVKTMIVNTFETACGRFQSDKEAPKAFLVTFGLKARGDEEGYRHLDLLIYASGNYVGVYHRERWNVIDSDDLTYDPMTDETYIKPGKDYAKGDTGWKICAYHDSAWRDDGVGTVLRGYRHQISTLQTGFGHDWFKLVRPPEDLPKK